jgi:hypothetical protein
MLLQGIVASTTTCDGYAGLLLNSADDRVKPILAQQSEYAHEDD